MVLQMNRFLGRLRPVRSIHYIGGSDVLPAPLGPEEEQKDKRVPIRLRCLANISVQRGS